MITEGGGQGAHGRDRARHAALHRMGERSPDAAEAQPDDAQRDDRIPQEAVDLLPGMLTATRQSGPGTVSKTIRDAVPMGLIP